MNFQSEEGAKVVNYKGIPHFTLFLSVLLLSVDNVNRFESSFEISAFVWSRSISPTGCALKLFFNGPMILNNYNLKAEMMSKCVSFLILFSRRPSIWFKGVNDLLYQKWSRKSGSLQLQVQIYVPWILQEAISRNGFP